jgi:isocitrate dehydrogenase
MAKEYPHIQTDHQIVDIATARVAAKPHQYDVIVTSNLYGDIISDVAAEVAGSVGLAGSANIGSRAAMFEVWLLSFILLSYFKKFYAIYFIFDFQA